MVLGVLLSAPETNWAANWAQSPEGPSCACRLGSFFDNACSGMASFHEVNSMTVMPSTFPEEVIEIAARGSLPVLRKWDSSTWTILEKWTYEAKCCLSVGAQV